ncbi:PelD GGDEF domain-containing protein [Comamonas composti]|uniref:PelD GGDEF domain-containing protein n=1 Tax=Comamonas composti TaxID=408558 RepID=UPI0003FB4C67|nr:PelD GGDEF domain-containing protein [Comamonas composti]
MSVHDLSSRGATQDAPRRAGIAPEFRASPLGLLVRTSTKPWIVVFETLLLPVLALWMGWMVNPEDALWVHAEFPWAWIAPMLVALRYGPIAGLSAAGVLLLGWLGLNRQDLSLFPSQYFLGGLIVVMIVGEISSIWHARIRRARTAQAYMDQRTEQLVRQHYLLRLSHDRLEQELIGRPVSMRDALRVLSSLDDGPEGAQSLLNLLAQFSQISAASLVRVSNGVIEPQPMAQLGGVRPVEVKDALVRQAMGKYLLCHVAKGQDVDAASAYLVVAPMLDLSGEIYGLLLVEEMPFFALQEESLQTINLLLGYYTDCVAANRLAQPLLQAYPNCPLPFAFELQRMEHVNRNSSLSSVVVVLELSEAAAKDGMAEQIMRLERMLDRSWLIEKNGRQMLAILMPLGTQATAEGYLNRIESWLDQRGMDSLGAAGIFPHTIVLRARTALSVLEELDGMTHA